MTSSPVNTATDRASCAARDADDPLASVRDQFDLPEGVVYLDGNSLGALPAGAAGRVQEMVTREWGQGLIRSWNDAGWFTKPQELGNRIAPLVGAGSDEVVVCDTTSINLFKVLVAALGLRPGRDVIVSDSDSFPTDLYMIQGVSELVGGYETRLVGSGGPQLEDVLDDRVAAVVLTHVDYRTGRMYDLDAVTRQVQAAGALMIWDLAHSAGAVPVDLTASGADFAIGCSYKYLNGGPGAPAFLWVAPHHQAEARQPLTGWHGHRDPFAFVPDYSPAEGITRFVVSTPQLLSYPALEASLDVWEQVDMAQVRAKSLALTDLFIELVEEHCGRYVEVVTPREHDLRGSQVSLRHADGYAVMQALIERGVIGDFRAPDLIRFGFTPLYVGYADVWDAVQVLREILDEETWRAPRFARRGLVT